MSVVINTNSSATLASLNLANSNANLSRSLNRLSSGSRIVSPADDAGGLAVSMKQSAATRRLSALNNNLGNTLSFLQTQDGVLKVAGKVLDRISELKTLSVDPTKNASDLANYDVEFKALQQQLTSLGSEKFNGVSLFGTTAMSVQVADDPSQTMSIAGIDLMGSTAGGGSGHDQSRHRRGLDAIYAIWSRYAFIERLVVFLCYWRDRNGGRDR